MRIWVNFKALREKLRFEDVLRHYKVEVKRKGSQHQGPCPLPGHGEKRSASSFSANLDRGIFQCFVCGAKGNVLDFACLMSGSDSTDGDALRAVAVELQQKFFPRGGPSTKGQSPTRPLGGSTETPVVVNVPLEFELKGLEANHPYLASRGFRAETMAYFGVGYCSRGLLKDRIAIPLHDPDGQLVGYAGRVTDDALVSEDSPKYRLPGRRERGGKIYEVRRSLLLYNAHRIERPCDDLIVVAGFPSVWWLNQHGFISAVALMGFDCSPEQAELTVRLVQPGGRIWFLLEGHTAGEKLAHSALALVAPHRFVRWVSLNDTKQPTDLGREELRSLLVV